MFKTKRTGKIVDCLQNLLFFPPTMWEIINFVRATIEISIILLVICSAGLGAHAQQEKDHLDEIFSEQRSASGVDELSESLPSNTIDALEKIGLDKVDWKSITKLVPEKIFEQVFLMLQKSIPAPFGASVTILAVILLCALMDSVKSYGSGSTYKKVLSAVGCLCICVVVVGPIVKFFDKISGVIQSSNTFMLGYVPVLAGVMLSAGQTVSASSYQISMMFVGEVITQVASQVLLPLLSMFLAISVVASISQRIDISGFCNFLQKIIKWTLGLAMTIFTGVLTLQSIVGAAADSTGARALKFMISSFVPVVGGALSEAFTTVHGGLKLLKSGVGVFGICAFGFMFLPVLAECIVWVLSLYFCAAISRLFNLGQISGLLNNTGQVIATLISVILCCMTILIVSTVIVLTIGNSG